MEDREDFDKREGNFLSEWYRCGSDTKNGGWDILSVFPIRHFN